MIEDFINLGLKINLKKEFLKNKNLNFEQFLRKLE